MALRKTGFVPTTISKRLARDAKSASTAVKRRAIKAVSEGGTNTEIKRRLSAIQTGGSGAAGETGEPQGGYPIPEPVTYLPSGPTDVVSPGGGGMTTYGLTPGFAPGPGGAVYPGGGVAPYGGTGLGGISIGPGGIQAQGTLFGIPISGTLPFGGGNTGSEAPAGPAQTGGGECPGWFSVKDPITGQCINLDALPPGGAPAMTGAYLPAPDGGADGYGPAVKGYYGVGLVPRVEVQKVRRCPPGMALGRDGVCYEGLSRNSPKRAWPMGMKPLLTPGERRAIRIATSAAGKLKRAQKGLKKAGRALEKVC